MKRILIIVLALTVLLGVACKDPVAPETTYYGATPAECMFNLELAFNARDIGIFEIQLSPTFTFYFNPSDYGLNVNGYIIPTSWGYDHMRRAVWNMVRPYADGGAFDISMQLPENDIGAPPEGATEYTVDNISLSLMVMINENDGLIANKGTMEFGFEKANNGAENYWRLTDWRDYTYAKKGVEGSDLGMIFAYFYSINPLDPTQ